MADVYSPEPRSSNNLADYIQRLTCKHCAGAGKLTTSIAKTFMGDLFRETSVRRCEPCNGWGVEGAGDRR